MKISNYLYYSPDIVLVMMRYIWHVAHRGRKWNRWVSKNQSENL